MERNISSTVPNTTTTESELSDFYAIPVQVLIMILLFMLSVVANGLLLFLLARFKALQTTSNILVLDLAAVDLLNVLINVPLFMCYGVLDLNAFRGRITAWVVSTFHVLFAYLTLTTMFLMMIYRFLAIRYPLKYQDLKTRRNIFRAIFAKWFLSFVAVLCVYAPLYKINLGNCSLIEYRETYNRESNAAIPRILAPPVLLGSISMYFSSWKRLSRRLGANWAQNTTGQNRKQKALNTILIIIVIFCASYLPEIVRSARPLELIGHAREWLQFILNFALFLPSTINPFIYFVRVESFRRAFKELAWTQTDRTPELRVKGILLQKDRFLPPSGNILQKTENLKSADVADTSFGMKNTGVSKCEITLESQK